MRPERLYLQDIVDAAEAVTRFVEERSEEQFLNDEILMSAVLHKLTVIGEAASRMPKELRETHPEVPWGEIIGFRNFLVHAYFAIEWSIIWTTAKHDVPELKAAIKKIRALLPLEDESQE